MILFKIAGVAWMLAWFLLILKTTIEEFNVGDDLMGYIFALGVLWFFVGLLPVLIVDLLCQWYLLACSGGDNHG